MYEEDYYLLNYEKEVKIDLNDWLFT